jgi:hypothetical protein
MRGEVLAWRDALHEGPVPAGDVSAVREARVAFAASRGWAPREVVEAWMRERDERLAAALGREPVVLWFEHDLYDQLQLIQVLARVPAELAGDGLLEAIVVDRVAGRPRFRGLGELAGAELAALWPLRRPLEGAALEAARRAWAAFTGPDPRALEEPLDALPLLRPALRRLLEEHPAVGDGLSRSERQALRAAADGAADPLALFLATQDMEEAPFSGDRQFWDLLLTLAAGDPPLLALSDPKALRGGEPHGVEVELTEAGAGVLEGRADAVALRGVDRWIGGVHLHGTTVPWRWDPAAGRIIAFG